MKVYLTVDEDRCESMWEEEPYRGFCSWHWNRLNVVELPKGTIKKLIGKELTWEDEPYEWEGETE